jgi:hypothetical protein
MTDRAQALLREALALPPDERADVAAELLASLDDPETDTGDNSSRLGCGNRKASSAGTCR